MADKLKITSKGQGVPLVLLHGWGVNSGIWQPTVENLAQYFQVITIDLPGFGVNHQYQVSEYTLDNIATIVQEHVKLPAIYLGWSLGGLVATKIAQMFPDKLRALISVCSSPYFIQTDDWSGIEPSVLEMFHRQISKDTRKTIDNFLKIQAMGSPHVRNDIKLIRQLVMQYPMANQATLTQSLALLSTTDLRSSLALIEQPFLRLYGRLDSLVPLSAKKQIDQLVPDSDSVIFENASHAPFISDFNAFNSQIVEWLKMNV